MVRGQPFSVRTDFNKNRLCDGVWHCVQVRLDGSLLSMKVDKRQYTKTEPRVNSIDMRGPLFIAGFSEQYSPPYLSVRTKEFLHGNLRSLRINEKQVDWLAPRSSGIGSATPEFHRYGTGSNTTGFRQYPVSPVTTKRTVETKNFSSSASNNRAYLWNLRKNKVVIPSYPVELIFLFRHCANSPPEKRWHENSSFQVFFISSSAFLLVSL